MHRKLKRATSDERRVTSVGFTFTEVIVASTLLILGMVPILKALTTAHVNTAIIEHRTNSLILAQYKLDEIKARSIYNYGSSFALVSTPIDGSYLCTVADSSVSSNLRKITVSVGYDNNSNSILEEEEIQVTLATLLARRW
jgi:Tfp pilus assembly protein PilV